MIYTGNSCTLHDVFSSHCLEDECLLILVMENRWIRTSPIKEISISQDNKFIFKTLNSVYELEYLKGKEND